MGTLDSMVECEVISNVIGNREKEVKGIVVKQSDLKAGTGQNGDWQMKVFTLEDESGQIEITAWNDDIKKLLLGSVYEIEGIWWKEYEGNWTASLGKYSKVTSSTQLHVPNVEPIPEPTPTTPTESPHPTVILTTNQKIVHDEVWAFALAEATKVYPLGTAGGDPNLTSRLILAQVFYKKNMDYMIHVVKAVV